MTVPCNKCLVPPKSYLGLGPYEVYCDNRCMYSLVHLNLKAKVGQNISDLIMSVMYHNDNKNEAKL